MARPRGAFVELNMLHGEMLPAYAHLAELAGIDADFHVLTENLALGPFEGTGIEASVVPIDVEDPHDPCRDDVPASRAPARWRLRLRVHVHT